MKKLIGIIALSSTSLSSLLLCPFSKVEESFNLQATHDLYYHGFQPAFQSTKNKLFPRKEDHDEFVSKDLLQSYDHLQYPGVVPRTFLGPLILSFIMKLISVVLHPIARLEQHPIILQTLSRGILLLFNIHAHYRLANAASSKCDGSASTSSNKPFLLGLYFLLVTASQFHLPFYMSRMLPNTFALILVTHAYAEWFYSKPCNALVLLVFCTAIFRCDTLLLLFTVGLTILIRREVSVVQCLKIGVITGIISLTLTVPIDSMMWQRVVWPEGEVLFFNTVENKSSEYGVSPWHWYFLKALPKGMLLTLLLVPMAFLRLSQGLLAYGSDSRTPLFDFEWIFFFIPVIAFIGLYSILPHKEIRFIFVAFPMLNIMAAKGLVSMHKAAEMAILERRDMLLDESKSKKSDEKKKTGVGKRLSRFFVILLYLGSLFILVITCIGSFVFVAVSKENYPGGHALAALTSEIVKRVKEKEDLVTPVYIDVASAMTGVSLFGQNALMQICQGCEIQKGGYELENEHSASGDFGEFEYILSENSGINGYKVLSSIKGYPRLDLKKLDVITEDAIFVLERLH